MKTKLENIRRHVESLRLLAPPGVDRDSADDINATITEDLEHLEVLARHIDDYDDFDIESWAKEFRQLIEEMDD